MAKNTPTKQLYCKAKSRKWRNKRRKKGLLLRNDPKIRIYTLELLEERHLLVYTSTYGNGIWDRFQIKRCVDNLKRTPAR